MKLAIHGAAGRMGRAIAEIAFADGDVELKRAIDAPHSSHIGNDVGTLVRGGACGILIGAELSSGLADVDVVIDFSTPAATAALVRSCLERRVAAVIGTTGLSPDAGTAIGELAKVAPVVVAPNMSTAVTVLFHLAGEAARLLGSDFDAEIVEMHHRHKTDAPGGTALRLAEVVAHAKGLTKNDLVHGREGAVGARPARQIGVMAMRGGDVVGDHTLVLAGAGERIELSHRAQGREIFARGAVRAAKWVIGRDPGLYDMTDVLGIS